MQTFISRNLNTQQYDKLLVESIKRLANLFPFRNMNNYELLAELMKVLKKNS